jgi:hypothetical protein
MMMLASSDETDITMMAIGFAGVCFIIWVIMHYVRATRVAAYNARLKQLMIERGMSATDIERVLNAGNGAEIRQALQRYVAVELDGGREDGCCAGNARVKADGS